MSEGKHTKTSHSKCEVFNECLLRGYFQYIIYAPPEPKFKDNSFIGSYTHDCIEDWLYYYADINVSNLQYPASHFSETMGGFYRAAEETIPRAPPSEPMGNDEIICNCLDNFVDFMVRRLERVKKLNMADMFAPILVEKEFICDINGVPLQGYLDAGFQDTQYWFFDWKTNKKPEIIKKYITQATRYALLLDASGEYGDKPVTDFYMINLRNRVDLAKAHVIITDEMKKNEEAELLRLWDLMNGSEFPKPGHNKNCFFCDYKLRCLSYPTEGATHDWSIPVEYVSYSKQLPTQAPPLTQEEILAVAAADPAMEEILADLGIINEKPKASEPKEDTSDLDWWI
jgi:CRISPR/Cas system-associated exonuclease Cas4 (RecB family)